MTLASAAGVAIQPLPGAHRQLLLRGTTSAPALSHGLLKAVIRSEVSTKETLSVAVDAASSVCVEFT
ncbi:unnamed protein product, partial [Trichogramma brassicae]